MPVQRHLSPLGFLESFVLPGIAADGPRGADCAQDLVVARADGSDPRTLVSLPAGEFLAEWSPDGSRVAFVAQRDLNPEIYVVDRDGSDLQRLTSDWTSDILPRWSPDGDRIAFLSDRGAASFGSRYDSDVHVLDLSTGAVHQVSKGTGDALGFSWSPDGEQIAYVRSSDHDSLGDIWVVDADGGPSTVLHDGPLGWPSWSHDGTSLAVVTGRGTEGEPPWRIGVLDIATGLVRDLGLGADLPIWTGDGHAIVTRQDTEAGSVTVLIDPRSGERTTIEGVPAGRPSPDGAWTLYPGRPAPRPAGARRE